MLFLDEPTLWGQTCFNSDSEPFEITDFDLGHPVLVAYILRVGSSENSMSCSLTCMLTNMENFMLFNMHVTQHAIWFI